MKTHLLIFLIALVCPMASYGQEDSLKSQVIEEVKISGKSKKEIAYKSSRYYIMDFHIDTNGTFVLLNRFRKYYLYALDDRMKPKMKKYIPFHPKSVYMDCTGQFYVMSKDSMYQVEKKKGELVFTKKYPITRYQYYYKDCVANNDAGMIFQIHRNSKQETEFYQIDSKDLFTYDLYYVKNKKQNRSIKDSRKELKEEERRLMRKYGRDLASKAPTWREQTQANNPRANQSTEFRHHLNQKQFFEDFVLRPHYNPLFVSNDTTYIFDHVNGLRIRIDKKRKVIDKTVIDYHNEKRWKGEMHLDTKRKKFYSVQQRHGAQIFGLLSLDGKRIVRKTKITRHAYPEKVIVYNGFAYYVYRQFVDDNLNKLFRQKL